MAKWDLSKLDKVCPNEEEEEEKPVSKAKDYSQELETAIKMLKQTASTYHAGAPWGFSGTGFWLEQAADYLDNLPHSTNKITSEKKVVNMARTCRRKPATALAVKWDGTNDKEVELVAGPTYKVDITHPEVDTESRLKINTVGNEWDTARVGDYIVRTNGEILIMSQSEFDKDFD